MKPKPRITIEYPSVGATYHREEYGVYRYDEYQPESGREGRERRSLLARFDKLKDARDAYPGAQVVEGSGYHETPHILIPPEWFDDGH